MKVTVNAGMCTACGVCTGICPKTFRCGGDVAMVIAEQVDEADVNDCREAAESCPVGAITLRESTGSDLIQEEDFLELVKVLGKEFRRYVRRRVMNPSDYDDVLADAVETAWEQRRKFTPGTNFRSWMFRILTNKSFAHNRRTRRFSTPLSEKEESDLPSRPGGWAIENANHFVDRLSDQVAEAIEAMRPPERRCILLKAMRHYTYKEIATVLDIPVGTVMTHLARGRARAKEVLGCASLGEFMHDARHDSWEENVSPHPHGSSCLAHTG